MRGAAKQFLIELNIHESWKSNRTDDSISIDALVIMRELHVKFIKFITKKKCNGRNRGKAVVVGGGAFINLANCVAF